MPNDALRYWELRRIGYNLALTAVAGLVVLRTWPHFLPAVAPSSLLPLAVLAGLANLCYCTVYLVEAVARPSAIDTGSRPWRWKLWLAGTVFAMLIEYYWIVDEIYPAVPFVHS